MQSPFSNISPVVKNLLIINILCFIPSIFLTHGDFDHYVDPVSVYLGLHYFDSPAFGAWQILTYMFLHGGWAHILFNMFALFSFGPILEYTIGSKRFLTLYFVCGISAALLQIAVQAYEVHSLLGSFTVAGSLQTHVDAASLAKLQEIYSSATVGASGAIFGVLIGFGMLYPDMELIILFFPVPIKAKYIIPLYCAFEVFMGVGQFTGDDVAHFAHIGGALFGFILIKAWGLKSTNRY